MHKSTRIFGGAALLLATCLFVFSCNSDTSDAGNSTTDANNGTTTNNQQYENKVVDYMPGNPQQLNPYNRTDAASAMLLRYLYQSLVYTDYFSYEQVPQLATALPVLSERDGKILMDMEIRPEAKWDNGTPITGEDVAFSLKVLKLPKADNAHFKPYFEYIEDVIIDSNNPRKFTLVCKEPYMLMTIAIEDLPIIPAYVYDAPGILKKYTLKQIANANGKLDNDPQLNKVAENFNSPKFQNKTVVGSGPYQFKEWLPNQRITLKKKENWWGDALKGKNHWFEAKPDEITYEIINDPTTAVVALKGEKIDAINRVEPRAFVEELKESKSFTSKFNTYTPTQFLYAYIGMNMRNEKFEDVRVRRAMRHIMDTKTFQDKVFYGMAEHVASFIHPSKKKFLNPKVKPSEYNLDKAAKLMAQAGWKDSNGNGTLDKNIDGELVEFEADFVYPNVAKTSEKAVLMFQEAARQIGIKVNAVPLEFTVMIEKTKSHDFDMYYGIWSASPLESDPKQIWHTDSYNGGSNYVGFGTSESDQLIDDLRKELDEIKRAEIYKELQELIDKDAPYVFMSATQNRVAVHNKFGDIKDTGINPGYFTPGLGVLNAIQD